MDGIYTGNWNCTTYEGNRLSADNVRDAQRLEFCSKLTDYVQSPAVPACDLQAGAAPAGAPPAGHAGG